MFLFDTDHIVLLQRGAQPESGRIRRRMASHSPAPFFFCLVNYHEQLIGANSYINRARLAPAVVRGYAMLEEVRTHYTGNQVLPFDRPAADRFDALRVQKVRIGTMDLRIASIALCRGLVVLTRNLSDFRQVPGLSAEDWTV